MSRGLGFLLVSVLRFSSYIAIYNLTKNKAQKLSPTHPEPINHWCIYNHHNMTLENPLWWIASDTTPVPFYWDVAHCNSHRFKLQTHFEQTLQNGSLAFVSISILQSSGKDGHFPSCTHLIVCCSRGLAKERRCCAVLSTQCSLRTKQQLFLSSILSPSDNRLC